MDVSWVNPTTCASIDHYNIVEIAADGNPKQSVQQVSAGSTFGAASGLHLCTFYRFGVQAVYGSGRRSAVVLPDHFVFMSGRADPYPPVVSIVLQGIGSSGA
jgi:hypothetical protein